MLSSVESQYESGCSGTMLQENSTAKTTRSARVVVIDDQPMILDLMRDILMDAGHKVYTYDKAGRALEEIDGHGVDVLFTDLCMPGIDGLEFLKIARRKWPVCKVVIFTGYGAVEHAVKAIKAGASDFLTKPVNNRAIVEMVERLFELQCPLAQSANAPSAKGEKVNSLLFQAQQAASTNFPVVLLGETGVGKEVFADFIQAHSPRRTEAYIKVNCAAFSDTLIESELFGHERGAFTGANQRHLGRFDRAHRGTLFLDEIGELSTKMQTKLLRVLQTHEFERVGGNETINVDIRLICATHRDLLKMSKDGTFRQDLYYRINTIPIHIPPLRERADEIPELAMKFVAKVHETLQRGPESIEEDAIRLLQSYPWPGNIRELENCMERACLLSTGKSLKPSDLWWLEVPTEQTPTASGLTALEEAERNALKKTLTELQWNFTRAATALNMSRSTLYLKAGKYSLSRPVV